MQKKETSWWLFALGFVVGFFFWPLLIIAGIITIIYYYKKGEKGEVR